VVLSQSWANSTLSYTHTFTQDYSSLYWQVTAVLPRIDQIDAYLRVRWEPGAFVWDEAWQPAYPPEPYWWLYGRPKGAAVS
jgi:hypothetical protein